MKRIITLLSIFFVCSSVIWAQSEEEATNIVNVGNQMPDFILNSNVYGSVNSKDLKGKVVLITIFATWCPPCQKELKAIKEVLYPKFESNPSFCMLVVGREHNEEELTEYNQKKQFKFALYPDAKREFTNKFATKFIPRTYVVNKNGMVVWASSGFNDSEFATMTNLIEGALE